MCENNSPNQWDNSTLNDVVNFDENKPLSKTRHD